MIWIGLFSVGSLTVIRLPKVSSGSRFGWKHVLFFWAIENILSSSAFEYGTVEINLEVFDSFLNQWEPSTFFISLKKHHMRSVCILPELLFASFQTFCGMSHHREAGNCEILMPSCLALMNLERVVDLDTWKMKKINTIIKEKVGYINTNFWKISPPISMLYVNLWLPYAAPLVENNFPLHHLLIIHPFLLIFGQATSFSYLLMNIL